MKIMSTELLAKFEGTIKIMSENDFGKFGISKGSVMESAKSLMNGMNFEGLNNLASSLVSKN